MKHLSHGYAGKFLRLDLRAQTARAVDLDSRLLEYVGGLGIATRLFMDAYQPGLQAEDEANPLIIFTGPLTGTNAPTASRTAVVSLSPQTRALAISNFGGFFGTALKQAGYDGIVLEGKSRDWACVVIDGQDVRFASADELVGKDTWDTQDTLAARLAPDHPEKVHVLAVGTAGEHGVSYASLTADYFSSASRCGLGTVMGQKRIKAIAVQPHGGHVMVADAPGLRARVLYALEKHRSLRVPFGVQGYGRFVAGFCDNGLMPHGNFRSSRSPVRLTAETAVRLITQTPSYRARGVACNACPNACYLSIEANAGPYRGLRNTGTVPANLLCWAGRCGVRSYEAVWKLEELSDRLGLDIFSASTVISCAIDLFESGRLTRDDTDGLVLRMGDEATIIELLHRIARAEGAFARLLGKGADAVTAHFGGFSSTVKRLEMWGIDPRVFPLPYTIGDLFSLRGGDNILNTHNTHFLLHKNPKDVERALIERLTMPEEMKKEVFTTSLVPESPRGIALLVKWVEEFNTLLNCLGTCILEQDILHFTLGSSEHYGEMYKCATGLPLDAERIRTLADRVMAMHRVVAVNSGLSTADDSWPDRFYDEPIADGPSRGRVVDRQVVREAVLDYHALRGWDHGTGLPQEPI